MGPIDPGWNKRLKEARGDYPARMGVSQAPTYAAMAADFGKASPSTIYRTFMDAGRQPDGALLRSLAKSLNVLEDWLLYDRGPRTKQEAQEQREARERAERVEALRPRLAEVASPGVAFHPAAEALVVEVARRWLNLPLECYRDRTRPSPETVIEEIRELIAEVARRIPRPGQNPEDPDDPGSFETGQWDLFTIGLLRTVWDGLPEAKVPSQDRPALSYDPNTGGWVFNPHAPRIEADDFEGKTMRQLQDEFEGGRTKRE